MSEQAPTLLQALLAVQKEIPTLSLGKDATNPHFKNRYLSLSKLHEEVLPLLNRHGLVWITRPMDAPGGPVLYYELALASTAIRPSGPQVHPGYSAVDAIGGVMPLMLDKDNSQGLGSAITYARRYALSAVLGITPDDDDDGAKASEPRRQQRAPAPANGEGSPVLTPEQTAKVVKAIEDAGKNVDLILGAVGVESTDDLTAADARKIKLLLDGGTV